MIVVVAGDKLDMPVDADEGPSDAFALLRILLWRICSSFSTHYLENWKWPGSYIESQAADGSE